MLPGCGFVEDLHSIVLIPGGTTTLGEDWEHDH